MRNYLKKMLVFLCGLIVGAISVYSVPVSQAASSVEPDGGWTGAADEEPMPVMAWLTRTTAGPSFSSQTLAAVMDQLKTLDVKWITSSSLLMSLRQKDEQDGILAQARLHLKQGRKLHLGLNLDKAVSEYRKSVELMEQGFALYYEPKLLADPLLQLGVAQYQAGDRVMAKQAFMRVAALTPDLKLAEGYYSPSIRKAYSEAVRGLGLREPTIPSPGELRRICEALDIRGLVVASSERLGDRPLLRLGVFDRSYGSFVDVETVVLGDQDTGKAGEQLAKRLRPALAGMLGLRLAQANDKGGQVESDEPGLAEGDSSDGGMSDGNADGAGQGVDLGLGQADGSIPGAELGSGEQSWAVRYWWIWPAAAVVLTSIAVALPLTVFREDVVDVKVRY